MIHIVTGPPCSGKSTHVKANAAPGDVIVDYDVLAVALGSTTPHASRGAVRTVTSAARKAAVERVLLGVDSDSWIIHSWPSTEQLDRYKAAGAELLELDPGIDVAIERAQTDDRPEGTIAAIRAWYAEREEASTMPQKAITRRTKAVATVRFKAAGELDPTTNEKLAEGEFVALAAVFGNVDSYGEKVAPGAFTDTLAAWAAKGDPIPVIWYHNWSDPFAHIGVVLWAKETDEGLLYKGRIDLEDPFAAKVYKLMKGRRVTQQSFGFDIVDAGEVVEDGVHVYEIRAVDLFEVGPCLVGVNQATELVDIKSASDSTASVEPEHSGQVTPPATDDSSSSVTPGSTPDEPPVSKGLSPASVSLIIEQYELEMES